VMLPTQDDRHPFVDDGDDEEQLLISTHENDSKHDTTQHRIIPRVVDDSRRSMFSRFARRSSMDASSRRSSAPNMSHFENVSADEIISSESVILDPDERGIQHLPTEAFKPSMMSSMSSHRRSRSLDRVRDDPSSRDQEVNLSSGPRRVRFGTSANSTGSYFSDVRYRLFF